MRIYKYLYKIRLYIKISETKLYKTLINAFNLLYEFCVTSKYNIYETKNKYDFPDIDLIKAVRIYKTNSKRFGTFFT